MSVKSGVRYLMAVVLASVLAGCATTGPVANPGGQATKRVDPSVSQPSESSGVSSQDLQEVTDKMARSILSTPAIASAQKPPVIVLLPVKNDTRFPINKQLFTMRIKAMLNQQCQGKVLFAARDRIDAVENERDMKREGMVSSGKQGNMAGADFFLTGELTGLSQASSKGQSDYVLYTFRLINAETSIEQWENFHEIKKTAMEDAAYR